MTFSGFHEEIINPIRIPEQFFHQVLFEIDDLDELKLTLYLFWRFDHMEGTFHYLHLSDLLKDELLVQTMGGGPRKSRKALVEALARAAARGTLLSADIPPKRNRDKLICLNSAKGRAIIGAVQRGEWRTVEPSIRRGDVYANHPNIFQLYESNIGPLTPMIADALRDAEKTYQASWIEDAFRIAVERNKRNLHYIEAILHRWQEEGRDDRKNKQDRRDTEEAIRKYGEWEK